MTDRSHVERDTRARETVTREVCLCAAIQFFSDGYIVRGHRHHDCLRSAVEMGRDVKRGQSAPCEQGFLTTAGRFVDRREGLRLQVEAGVRSADPNGYRHAELYSEDLY